MGLPEIHAASQDVALRAFADEPAPGVKGFTYEPEGLPALDVAGMFVDAAVLVVRDELDQPSSETHPLLVVRRSDLPQDPVTEVDYVTRLKTGQRYVVIDARPDGRGFVPLYLNEVPEPAP